MALSSTLPQARASDHRSQFAKGLLRFWAVMTGNGKVAAGVVIVGAFFLIGIFGPFFLRIDPADFSHAYDNAPSAAHLLGTTAKGEDIFSQLIVGTRASMFWGLLTAVLATIVALAVGLVCGYFGGIIDDCLSLLTNIFLVIPGLPLAIVMAEFFPRGSVTISIVIMLTTWPYGARIMRAQTLSMRNREFVTAIEASGERTWRTIFIEIFPNEISIIAAQFVSTMTNVILAMAALQFLGLGNPTEINWGSMLYYAKLQNALLLHLWWWLVPPGLCIALLGAGLTLINYGIDEIADPRLHITRKPKKRAVKQEAVA
jgi:peptide/nickel transport system permease protein